MFALSRTLLRASSASSAPLVPAVTASQPSGLASLLSSSFSSASAADSSGGSSGKTDTGAFVSSDSLGGAQAYTGFGDGGGSIFETAGDDSAWGSPDAASANAAADGSFVSDAEVVGDGAAPSAATAASGSASAAAGAGADREPSTILSDLGASYLVASIPGLKGKLEASHAATAALKHTDKAAVLAQALGKPLPLPSYRALPASTRARDPSRRPLRTPSWGALVDQLPVAGRALSKNIPGSYQKLGPIAATLRGMHVVDALPQMAFSKKRVAKTAVYKTLRSALTNAVSNAARKEGATEKDIDPGRFIISEAWVGKGIIRKRLKFHAKGRHGVEEKTRSHLWIQLKADPDYRPDAQPPAAPGTRQSQSVKRKGQLAATRRAEAARFISSLPAATAAQISAAREAAKAQ